MEILKTDTNIPVGVDILQVNTAVFQLWDCIPSCVCTQILALDGERNVIHTLMQSRINQADLRGPDSLIRNLKRILGFVVRLPKPETLEINIADPDSYYYFTRQAVTPTLTMRRWVGQAYNNIKKIDVPTSCHLAKADYKALCYKHVYNNYLTSEAISPTDEMLGINLTHFIDEQTAIRKELWTMIS